jgi:tetratricopeptide (TPR) repeat protein
MTSSTTTSLLQRLRARLWYAWGLSLCYTGHRTAERSYYEAGVEAFKRAASLWPQFAPAHYRSGIIKGREMGHYRAAIIDLDRATNLSPEWPEPYLQRGLFHRFNNSPAEAISELERFIELGGSGFWRGEAERQLMLIRADQAERGEG